MHTQNQPNKLLCVIIVLYFNIFSKAPSSKADLTILLFCDTCVMADEALTLRIAVTTAGHVQDGVSR